MILLIFYWLFSTLFVFGMDYEREDEFLFKHFIYSLLLGWWVLPISLGAAFERKRHGK